MVDTLLPSTVKLDRSTVRCMLYSVREGGKEKGGEVRGREVRGREVRGREVRGREVRGREVREREGGGKWRELGEMEAGERRERLTQAVEGGRGGGGR